MNDDEKKLGDFSRPDSLALPVTPPPAETQPVAPVPATPPPAETQPVAPLPITPTTVETQPVPPQPAEPAVDSWNTSEDSWESAPWGEEAEVPEPVFQPPPAEPLEDSHDDPRRPGHSRHEGISPLLIAAILLLVALFSAATWWWFMGRAPENEQGSRQAAGPSLGATPAPPPVVAATEPPPKPDLPPLDASDSILRSWLRTLSQHPQLPTWLAPEDLGRRFVTTVDNISRGESPRPHLGVLEPEGSFEITHQHGAVVAAPSTSRRYDLLVDVFTSVDIAAGARLFHDVEPLLEEAYQELGDPSRDFRGALTEAIDHLLAVPVPDQPPALVKGVLTYRYVDPQLEALSPAAKHLLRLGPENARKVQAKLRFFRAALDLPD